MADKHTVLLVEDDSQVREMLAAALAVNFDVVVAAQGEEAIEVIAERQVDLLLTDVVIPGRNGFDLADRAVSMRPGLRVIYMTGYSSQARDPSRAKHGKLILKLFKPTQMISEINSVLAA